MEKETSMNVKIKRLVAEAVIPSYAKEGDAGMDLTATSVKRDGAKIKYGTGLAFEIPPGHVGFIFPRSSIHKTDLRLTNSVGVIDSGYRGEVMAVFDMITDAGEYASTFAIGERIAQLVIMPIPKIELEVVHELSNTERGVGGFGSTGK